MLLPFTKAQGTGNNFIILYLPECPDIDLNKTIIQKLCHNNFGVGADGLILVRNHADYDFQMIYFNADGHEGSMCGNGGRACVRFAHDLGIISEATKFIAVDGEHEASVTSEQISLKMSAVNTVESGEGFQFMDTGSPHYVTFVNNNLRVFNVVEEGRNIRNNKRFKTEGTNVNFVEKKEANALFVRTYERGVEDETLSCGTGVTACALSASYQGFDSPINIEVLGGHLQIAFEKVGDNQFDNIYLIGPAQKVFEGTINC